jgi:phosphonate transport system permease protein
MTEIPARRYAAPLAAKWRPQMADVTIYRWEYHFRASTVLGMVGVGGIGLELVGALRLMQYREVAAILLLVLVLVVLVDGFSGYLRKRLK